MINAFHKGAGVTIKAATAMEHQEQIGQMNRRNAEMSAALPPYRRLDWCSYVAAIVAVGLWFFVLEMTSRVFFSRPLLARMKAFLCTGTI